MRAVVPSDRYAAAMLDPVATDNVYFQSHGTYSTASPQVYTPEPYHAERYIRGGYPSRINGRGDNSDQHIMEDKSDYYVKGNNSLDVTERHSVSDAYARGDNSSVVMGDNSGALTVDVNKPQHGTGDVYANEGAAVAKEDNSAARGDNSAARGDNSDAMAVVGASVGPQVVCDRAQETDPAPPSGASPSTGPSAVRVDACDHVSQTVAASTGEAEPHP